MQFLFLVMFAVSLVFFSFMVRESVRMVPHLLDGTLIPTETIGWAVFWLFLFLLSFLGAGFFLYEREREEGRISKRIGIYEWILSRRRPKPDPSDSAPRRIRREGSG